MVIPLGNGASTLSAYGCATSNLVRYFESEQMCFYPFPLGELNEQIALLEAEAQKSLDEIGNAAEDVSLERFGLMRYRGQWLHNLQMRLPCGSIGPLEVEQVVSDFRSAYDKLYGSGAGQVSQGVELFTLRIRAIARLRRPKQASCGEPVMEIAAAARLGFRRIFWPDQMAEIESQVFDGRYLRFGNCVTGPAVVELPYTSITVGKGQALDVDAYGNLVLRLEETTVSVRRN